MVSIGTSSFFRTTVFMRATVTRPLKRVYMHESTMNFCSQRISAVEATAFCTSGTPLPDDHCAGRTAVRLPFIRDAKRPLRTPSGPRPSHGPVTPVRLRYKSPAHARTTGGLFEQHASGSSPLYEPDESVHRAQGKTRLRTPDDSHARGYHRRHSLVLREGRPRLAAGSDGRRRT